MWESRLDNGKVLYFCIVCNDGTGHTSQSHRTRHEKTQTHQDNAARVRERDAQRAAYAQRQSAQQELDRQTSSWIPLLISEMTVRTLGNQIVKFLLKCHQKRNQFSKLPIPHSLHPLCLQYGFLWALRTSRNC